MLSVMHYTMIQCCPFTVVYVNKTVGYCFSMSLMGLDVYIGLDFVVLVYE